VQEVEFPGGTKWVCLECNHTVDIMFDDDNYDWDLEDRER
jgi:hypothetical protein